jgi:hypothetical protein
VESGINNQWEVRMDNWSAQATREASDEQGAASPAATVRGIRRDIAGETAAPSHDRT